jgi:hypothetical protein
MTQTDLIVEWYANRIETDDGEIEYHAYGPKDSFVIFEGPNAKADCKIFMKAVDGSMAK